VQALEQLGHTIEIAEERTVAFGGGQVVRRTDGGWIGGSDPRRDGCVGGR